MLFLQNYALYLKNYALKKHNYALKKSIIFKNHVFSHFLTSEIVYLFTFNVKKRDFSKIERDESFKKLII